MTGAVFQSVCSQLPLPQGLGPGLWPATGLGRNTLWPCFQSEFSGPDMTHISSQQSATHKIICEWKLSLFLLRFWQPPLREQCVITDLTEVRFPQWR